ncbi:hypothetical protein I5Q34_32700 [Streptomyces sp. AV19]|uniref:hypothetical protein n=1 Tax=Streptomyces sp. AV19 TaxID=2793068 RepID=UPI0018FE5FDB|nr:hypothetical protein [Streptomyces sp. AV19]MBH1938967.1 hypothetical protein [Streptomyces sp. AV19]MDG4535300.1 hypothetical protein [Streptomyces sp. AV19]
MPTIDPQVPLNERAIAMARRLTRQEFEINVTFHSFGLQETDESNVPVSYPDDPPEYGQFLHVRPGRLDFFSGGHTHAAHAIVEVWDGAPTAEEAGRWEDQAEDTLTTVGGELIFWDMGKTEDVVQLGETGGTWGVRVASSGRSEVAELEEQGEDADGVEQYLLQFWRK